MKSRQIFSILIITVNLFIIACCTTDQSRIKSYYTMINSGEELEKVSRTGPYADIVIELNTGRFVFWRGSSYLPYWETEKGSPKIDEWNNPLNNITQTFSLLKKGLKNTVTERNDPVQEKDIPPGHNEVNKGFVLNPAGHWSFDESQIRQSYNRFNPGYTIIENPDIDSRILPSGENRRNFGAYYTNLKFYESWDNLWRFGDYPDVVVEFDSTPAKFIFWRGTGYIPMLINEKGQWYSNEFNETWGTSGGQKCQEPMSDKESYTNHVRIIENTPARVVVQWRYPLIDVLHVKANFNEETGWGDWADWYYTICPDGVAFKKMHLRTHGKRKHEWQESMVILGPDQHPEQVLETDPALMLAGLDFKTDTYSWVKRPPGNVDSRNKKIHIVNYRAEYNPFTIADILAGNVYGGEVTDYAVFLSWNHWPVAQMPTDGRYSIYPDRTAHSSLTHIYLPVFRENSGKQPFYEKIMIEGMTNKSPGELLPQAKSWLPPLLQMKIKAAACQYTIKHREHIS